MNAVTSASYWNGSVFWKMLTSADITTGSVTVTFSGSFSGALSIITFVPTPGTFLMTKRISAQQNSSGSSSISLSSAADSATDVLVYFGSNRAVSTDTVSRGTLQRQANDGSGGSGCLYTETGVTGVITASFLYSVAGSGNYQAIVVAQDFAVKTQGVIAPTTDAHEGAKHQPVKVSASVASTPSALAPVPYVEYILNGAVGSAYSVTVFTAGGVSPYTYAVTSGSLPAGLSLNTSSGVISGTPTAVGTSTFNITVTDSGAHTGTETFVITISTKPVVNSGYVA